MQASKGESLAHQQGHHAKQHHVHKVRRAELVGHLFKRDAILDPADKQRGSGLPLPIATDGQDMVQQENISKGLTAKASSAENLWTACPERGSLQPNAISAKGTQQV